MHYWIFLKRVIILCCPLIIAVSRVTQEASSASDRGSSQEQRTRSRMTICVHTRTEQWSGNSNFIIIIPWAWHPHPRLRRKQICIKPKSHQIIDGFIGTLGLYRARLRKVIEKSIRLIEGPTLTPYTNIFIDSCQSLNIKYNYYTQMMGIETKAKHSPGFDTVTWNLVNGSNYILQTPLRVPSCDSVVSSFKPTSFGVL